MALMRTVAERYDRQRDQAAARDRGAGQIVGLQFSSLRAMETGIQSAAQLPVEINDLQLQDEDGNMLYLPGYSDPAGPDIGAPGEGG